MKGVHNWYRGRLVRKKEPGVLTPEDLMMEVRDLCGVSDQKAKEIVFAILITMIRELKKPDGRIILPSMGALETVWVEPRTKEIMDMTDPLRMKRRRITVPGRHKVKFKPLQRFIKAMNGELKKDDSVTTG